MAGVGKAVEREVHSVSSAVPPTTNRQLGVTVKETALSPRRCMQYGQLEEATAHDGRSGDVVAVLLNVGRHQFVDGCSKTRSTHHVLVDAKHEHVGMRYQAAHDEPKHQIEP